MADETQVVSTTEEKTEPKDTSSEEKKEPAIDWSKVQVPEEVIKNHPEFKKVLTESIDRRQKIAALKQQVDALSGEKAEEKKPESTDKLTQLEQEINALKEANKSTTLATARMQAITENKIPEKFQSFVTGDTPESIAASAKSVAEALKTIPASPLTTSTAFPGAKDNTDEAVASAIMDRINGKGARNDPFSVGQQKLARGGGVNN